MVTVIPKLIVFPFAIKWEIKRDDLTKPFENDESLETTKFKAESLLTDMNFWFNFNSRAYPDEETQISLIINMDEDNYETICSSVTYSVKTANFEQSIESSFDNDFDNNQHGIIMSSYNELMDKENGFIVDGMLTIEISGTLSYSEQISINKPSIVRRLGSFLWNRNKKDFKIIVGDETIKAHKCVLQSRSTVFDKMLEKIEMKEAKENKVDIPDFNFEVIKNAIAFLYDRDIDPKLSLSNRMLLLQFSDKYDIQDLKETTENFLIDEIEPSNVCKISDYSIMTNSTKLRKECFGFLMKCSKKNIAISDFDILDKDFALEIFKYSFYRIADYS